MRQKINNARRLALASLLGLGLAAAPSAFADSSQCASIADPMQRAQCSCFQAQQANTEQTAAIIPQLADSNPYLQQVRTYQPGNNSSLGVAGVTQSCQGMTKSAFDSALSSVGGFLGFDISSVLGPIANATEGTICQSINNAIMQRTTIACPRVSIPGFPMNCSANLTAGVNGVQVGGSGALGGVSTGGSSSYGLGGYSGSGALGGTLGGSVNNAVGGYLNNAGGNVSSAVGGYLGGGAGGNSVANAAGGMVGGYVNPVGAAPSTATSSGGVISSISNSVSCWISGNNC